MKPIEIHFYVYPTDKKVYKNFLYVLNKIKGQGKSEFYRQSISKEVEDIKNKKKWSE